MTDQDKVELQQAVAKAMAAAASAETAAETARAQAAAASGDAARLSARLATLHEQRPERIQEALKSIPVVGSLLALAAKNFGSSLALLLTAVLVLGPIAYPLLLRAYLALLPEGLREQYAQVVAAPFLTSALTDLVQKNDERLDYIQHFPQTWSISTTDKSPAYPLSLVRGQEFSIKLRTRPASTVSCLAGSAELEAARDALAEKDLFSLYTINPSVVKTASGDEADWVEISGGESFWKLAPVGPMNDIAKVQVRLDKRKAVRVWPCFASIDADLLVIVQKSIKGTLPKTGDTVAKTK